MSVWTERLHLWQRVHAISGHDHHETSTTSLHREIPRRLRLSLGHIRFSSGHTGRAAHHHRKRGARGRAATNKPHLQDHQDHDHHTSRSHSATSTAAALVRSIQSGSNQAELRSPATTGRSAATTATKSNHEQKRRRNHREPYVPI